MGVADGGADVEEEEEALLEIERAAGAVLGDGDAVFDELHDEEGNAVGTGAAVEEAGDVGMFEAGEDLAFLLEATEDGTGVEAAAEELDGDFFLKGGVVADGAVDGAHAAAAEEAGDAIGAEALADGLFFGGEGPGFGALFHGGVEGGAGVGIGIDHGADLEEEFGIAGALAVEECLALRGGQIEGGVEECVDPRETLGGHFSPGVSWTRIQASAERRSRLTVALETPVASTISSRVRPPKYFISRI